MFVENIIMQFMASSSVSFLGEHSEDTIKNILQRRAQFLLVKILLCCGDIIDWMELFYKESVES